MRTRCGNAEMLLSTAATLVERHEPATLTVSQVHTRIDEELLSTLRVAHPGLRFEENGHGPGRIAGCSSRQP